MPIFERVSADIPVALKTANYTLVAADNGTELQFQSTTGVTASLPSVSAVENGFNVVLRNVGGGTLTVNPASGQTIDGGASLSLTTGAWCWIRNDGTTWKSLATGGGSAPPSGSVPSGAIMPYAGATAPTDWLLCDGATISRTTYAALFAVIGTAYGAGDGSTTFNVPDLRGRVPAGKDNMGGTAANRLTSSGSGIDGTTLGAAGGAQTHTLSIAEMPAHTHSVTGYDPGQTNTPACGAQEIARGTITTGSTGGGGAHQNTQPTVVTNYIIHT